MQGKMTTPVSKLLADLLPTSRPVGEMRASFFKKYVASRLSDATRLLNIVLYATSAVGLTGGEEFIVFDFHPIPGCHNIAAGSTTTEFFCTRDTR